MFVYVDFFSEMEIESRETAAVVDDMAESVHSDIEDHEVICCGYTCYISGGMRQPYFCSCENEGADQLCRNCTADQRLCFRYTDSTIPLLRICKISGY